MEAAAARLQRGGPGGNFFELTEWDFTEFNPGHGAFHRRLKVNSVCLTHTNPSVSHIFKHLPGKPTKIWNPDPGPRDDGLADVSQDDQATYKKQVGDPWFDTSVVVTRDQWDRLVLDYYRAMVRNLKKHGWLDKFYYFVDETAGTEKILHLVRLLKSDPETAAIRFAHCLQGFETCGTGKWKVCLQQAADSRAANRRELLPLGRVLLGRLRGAP
ncbi:MAG: hypothetical protein Ct9H300mP1_38150 [Planctomycetaceae bacterium]|nr:MAG: hypothetical protein Ct9H300mP1_38150 [Planctomycetaceae bacterium]